MKLGNYIFLVFFISFIWAVLCCSFFSPSDYSNVNPKKKWLTVFGGGPFFWVGYLIGKIIIFFEKTGEKYDDWLKK